MSAPTRIADLADLITVTRGVLSQITGPAGEIPVMSVAELRAGTPPKRFIDGTALAEAGLRIPAAGDTLISLEGAALGETFTVPADFPPFAASQQAAVVHIIDRSRLDPWYLGAWFTTEEARSQLLRLARGAAVQRIPIKDLGTVSIPPLHTGEYQRFVGRSFQTFHEAVKIHRDIAEQLEAMSLLHAEIHFDRS